MEQLLQSYLPIVIFIGVAVAIGAGAARRAVHRRLQAAGFGKAFGL